MSRASTKLLLTDGGVAERQRRCMLFNARGRREEVSVAGLTVHPVQRPEQRADEGGCFDTVLRCISGLFYRCDLTPPWRMSFIGGQTVELSGYSAQELQMKNGWLEIMHPDDRDGVARTVDLAVSQHERFDVNYRIITKEGSTRWVSERGLAVYGAEGEPLYLEGLITDISGIQQASLIQERIAAGWRRTLDNIPQMVWTWSADGSETYYNKRWVEFTGEDVGITSGKTSRLSLVHPADRERANKIWQDSLTSGEPYEARYRLRHATGEYRWVLSRGQLEGATAGHPGRWYGTCTDIHQQVQAREALQESESISRSMISASPDSICLLTPEGHVQFMNEAAEKASPPLIGEIDQPKWSDFFPRSMKVTVETAVRKACRGQVSRFTTSQKSGDELRWWDVVVAPIKAEESQVTGVITIARDMTHQKTVEERVRWAANHDALTGLPNRTLFQNALEETLVSARASGNSFAVLMVDLDDFKRTNDALGHDAGDALLVEFSTRLRGALRQDDVVARLGGDEFAVILRNIQRDVEIRRVVDSVQSALEIPFMHNGTLLDIRVSIGASKFPEHGADRTELLKHADIALYSAKANGKGDLNIFRSEMRADAQQRLSMLSLAKSALAEDRIAPFYQPKFDVRSGRFEGFEALLRWRGANGRSQPPAAIEAAFNEPVLAASISDRMIDLTISDMQRWMRDGVPFRHIALNAGAAELRRGDFGDRLLERLHRAGIDPSHLQLEVTETVFLGRGAEHVQRAIRMLAAHGIKIALDDFGTGYASLSHLNDFPVDILKIDKSFVARLETNPHDAAIVRAVIKLGHSLGIQVVAEGVETEAQLAFLQRQRCDQVQGYLLGHPMSGVKAQAFASRRQGSEQDLAA